MLDRCSLHVWRASFDVSVEYDPLISAPPPQVFARCSHCNQAFSLTIIRSSKETLQGSTVRHKENVFFFFLLKLFLKFKNNCKILF